MSGDNEPFSVTLTDEAFYVYVALSSKKVFERVDHALGLLSTSPHLGRIYDPVYKAASIPFEARVLFCLYYGIYYTVNEDDCVVTIFAIEDQRRNPQTRFGVVEL